MRKVIYLLIIVTIISCNNKVSDNGMYVDITKNDKVSFYDIFEKVEIIPLETTAESLIKHINSKIICYNGRYYIWDYEQYQILVFDLKGRFMFSINNRGGGPEEYHHIADFDIDEEKRVLTLLSAFDRTFHTYDLDGNFISRQVLPPVIGAYKDYRHLGGDTIMFLTFDEENAIKIYSQETNSILKEFYQISRDNLASDFGRRFIDKNHIVSAVDNAIYRVSTNGTLSEAYRWDFGKYNNAEYIERPQVTSPEESNKFRRQLNESEIVNYLLGSHGGNTNYYYVQLFRHNKPKSLLHNRITRKSLTFEKTKEGVYFFPFYWTDDYVLGTEGWEPEYAIPYAVLDNENKAIKDALDEFDNPVLLKYYFKK